jgi:predicted HicB family RNase H-like nuclease
MKRDDFDGFSVSVVLDEDGDWLAHFMEMPNISAFGATPERALAELRTAWRAVKESYRDNNEPVPEAPSRKSYSGHFNVRVDRRLHRALAIEASRNGVSLNALVAEKLGRSVKQPGL